MTTRTESIMDGDTQDFFKRALFVLQNLSAAIAPQGYRPTAPSEQVLQLVDRELSMLEVLLRPYTTPLYAMQINDIDLKGADLPWR